MPDKKPTVEELQSKIEKLEKQNEMLYKRGMELSEQVKGKSKNSGIKTYPGRADKPKTGGWIVTTPNTAFNGTLFGLSFQFGTTIVDIDYPDSDKIVSTMQYDFGYNVIPAEEKQLTMKRKQLAMKKPINEDNLVDKIIRAETL